MGRSYSGGSAFAAAMADVMLPAVSVGPARSASVGQAMVAAQLSAAATAAATDPATRAASDAASPSMSRDLEASGSATASAGTAAACHATATAAAAAAAASADGDEVAEGDAPDDERLERRLESHVSRRLESALAGVDAVVTELQGSLVSAGAAVDRRMSELQGNLAGVGVGIDRQVSELAGRLAGVEGALGRRVFEMSEQLSAIEASGSSAARKVQDLAASLGKLDSWAVGQVQALGQGFAGVSAVVSALSMRVALLEGYEEEDGEAEQMEECDGAEEGEEGEDEEVWYGEAVQEAGEVQEQGAEQAGGTNEACDGAQTKAEAAPGTSAAGRPSAAAGMRRGSGTSAASAGRSWEVAALEARMGDVERRLGEGLESTSSGEAHLHWVVACWVDRGSQGRAGCMCEGVMVWGLKPQVGLAADILLQLCLSFLLRCRLWPPDLSSCANPSWPQLLQSFGRCRRSWRARLPRCALWLSRRSATASSSRRNSKRNNWCNSLCTTMSKSRTPCSRLVPVLLCSVTLRSPQLLMRAVSVHLTQQRRVSKVSKCVSLRHMISRRTGRISRSWQRISRLCSCRCSSWRSSSKPSRWGMSGGCTMW